MNYKNQSYTFKNVYIKDSTTHVGPLEGKGPLSSYYDYIYDDYYFGEKTFEKAETKMMQDTVTSLLDKVNVDIEKINLFISGDLTNQIAVSSKLGLYTRIPFLGLYNACATSMESLIIGSNFIENCGLENVLVATSSHNKVAGKQFRYPNEYGGQRKPTQTTTVTGCFSVMLSNQISNVRVESATIGKVTSYGLKDPNDMGGAMAPAAKDTLMSHLEDLNRPIDYYDLILTGDLSTLGTQLLNHLLKDEYNLEVNNHHDAGLLIYDLINQDVQAGGSGAACIGVVSFSYIMDKIRKKELNRVLLIATGALFSPITVAQKEEIPCIAHAICLEGVNR